MKFLLVAINAKYIHSNPAIYSLRAYAGNTLREHVELAEYTINQQLGEILEDIYKRKPDVVGFSCYIWNRSMVTELLSELPKLIPGIPIWLGGPEVSFDAEVLINKYPQLSGVMIGEGEATFRELLQYYVDDGPKRDKVANAGSVQANDTVAQKGNKELMAIPGLYLRTGYTPMRELTDLSSLPFLYHDLTPFENRIIYYETSRGCPYRCSYCLSSIDKSVRLRDIDVVKKELQYFLDHNVKQVKFVDRTFNCNHDHAMTIWQYIKEHDNCVTNFHFEISADILRADEVELLQSFRPGLAQLEIGVQSVNPDTIHAISRVMNVDRLESIVLALQKNENIHLHLDLIAGLPYEDYVSFVNSFNRVYAMKPEQLQLGFLKVLKGSMMWVDAEKYGICHLENPPYEVLYTRWLTYEEICKLKRVEEMVELYYNSGQFTKTLPVLEAAFEGPFAMYEKLSEFYEERGYLTNHPARIYRYQILLEFAQEYDPGKLPFYRELLTYDLYLRENMKSRPSFAVDIQTYKAQIQDFYKREEKDHRFLMHYAEYNWKQLSKMTHLEPFHYPVWMPWDMKAKGYQGEEMIYPREEATYMLFDYQRRNPLNYQAKIQVISMDGKET